MDLVSGLVLMALSLLLITYGRPAAAGRLSAFVARPGMGLIASLLFTVLFTAGLALLIAGVIG
jgi:hypothetical protein